MESTCSCAIFGIVVGLAVSAQLRAGICSCELTWARQVQFPIGTIFIGGKKQDERKTQANWISVFVWIENEQSSHNKHIALNYSLWAHIFLLLLLLFFILFCSAYSTWISHRALLERLRAGMYISLARSKSIVYISVLWSKHEFIAMNITHTHTNRNRNIKAEWKVCVECR